MVRPARAHRLSGLGAATLAVLAGCQAAPTAVEVPPVDYPALAAFHNGRVEKLATVASRGVIEFRWIDEEGREHFEPQVNLDLWLNLPRRSALRMEKLGEVLMWLGSDDEQYWLFDLMETPTALYVGRHDAPVALESVPVPVHPLVLLDLMGLAPLPAPGPDAPPATADARLGAWIIETTGRSGPIRLHVDPVTRLPRAVEALDPEGEVTIRSELGRYRSVTQSGMSSLAFPKLAEVVRLRTPDESSAVDLFLSEPDSGRDEPFDRVFDLERLRRAMPTDLVREIEAPPSVATREPI